MRRDLMDKRGSLLLEATIATMILSIALVPLLGFLIAAAKVSYTSKEQTQVSFLLQKEAEFIKTYYRGDNFEDLPIDDVPTIYQNYSDSGFTLYRTVSEVEFTDEEGEPILDAYYVKHINIVIMKNDKTYGSVSFLLYRWGI